ncbi:MAG TPA: class I SAM-dependent methyltransferase [Marmoricola sp.]|nr:class I SAM-dependent methyltransferase [Marmoricola sp.]
MRAQSNNDDQEVDAMTGETPLTRWERARPDQRGYTARFAQLIAEGADIDAEARLADALLPRAARVLDAGSGMGRVAAALVERGHEVTGVEKDPDLVRESRSRYPEVPVVQADLLAVGPALLQDAGRPSSYDLVLLAGNVMVLLAPETECRVLRTLAALLAPGGRLLVGFSITGGPEFARPYAYDDFAADAAAAGLAVQHRFGTWDLAPAADDYAVVVLTPDAS